jgi:hypothetical protein
MEIRSLDETDREMFPEVITLDTPEGKQKSL